MKPTQIIRFKDTTSLIFVNVVASYPSVIEPKLNTIDPDPKRHYYEYTIDLLFPKTLDLTEFHQVIKEVIADQWPKGKPEFRNPYLRDGDLKIDKHTGEIQNGYAGMYYVVVKAKEDSKPTVIDAAKNPLTRPDSVIGGDIVQVFANCAAYDWSVNKGISFWLNTVKLIEKTSNPLGGGVTRDTAMAAMEAFDDVDMV